MYLDPLKELLFLILRVESLSEAQNFLLLHIFQLHILIVCVQVHNHKTLTLIFKVTKYKVE